MKKDELIERLLGILERLTDSKPPVSQTAFVHDPVSPDPYQDSVVRAIGSQEEFAQLQKELEKFEEQVGLRSSSNPPTKEEVEDLL